jgi:apolipoprotein N-acyltransferase
MVSLTMESALNRLQPKPELLLWPEVPAPLYYYTDAPFREHVTRLAQVTQTHFLFGTVSFTQAGAPLNSAVFLQPSGSFVSRYDKMYLVPFGEFIPPMFSWVNRITKEAGDFEPGRSIVVSKAGGHTVGTFICYESAFPHLVRRFANSGAEVLVNLTNDGYFGKTKARLQHLLLARMRAAENNRWVLRATNDGWTVSIDPAGRIVDRFPPFEERAGRLSFSWIPEKTFYTRYGDWFAWLCLASSVMAAFWAARRGALRT